MNGLEKEYPGTVACKVVDATTASAKTKIHEYGFGTHGLVVFDESGTLKSKIDGHRMTKADIQAAIDRATGG